MATHLTIPSLSALTTSVLGYFQTQFGSKDLGSDSWLGKQARSIALALRGQY